MFTEQRHQQRHIDGQWSSDQCGSNVHLPFAGWVRHFSESLTERSAVQGLLFLDRKLLPVAFFLFSQSLKRSTSWLFSSMSMLLEVYQNVWSVFLKADGGHWVVWTIHVDGFAVPSEADDFAVANLCQLFGLGARWSSARDQSQLTLGSVADSQSHHSTCHVDECVEFDPFESVI